LGAALFDYVEGGAYDGALVLDCAAGALLCDFLLWMGLLVFWRIRDEGEEGMYL
jgi:hypothetical protein